MDIKKELQRINKIRNKREKLEELNYLANDIANQFTYDMSFLEDAIADALDNTPMKIKEELNYFDVQDVTCDIIVKSSWE